jgi:hypothetical protein
MQNVIGSPLTGGGDPASSPQPQNGDHGTDEGGKHREHRKHTAHLTSHARILTATSWNYQPGVSPGTDLAG